MEPRNLCRPRSQDPKLTGDSGAGGAAMNSSNHMCCCHPHHHLRRLPASVGYAYWYQDGEKETLEGPWLIAERGNDVTYGLGGDVGVAGGFRVRAEWEVFDLASNYSADMFSVGLYLRLR